AEAGAEGERQQRLAQAGGAVEEGKGAERQPALPEPLQDARRQEAGRQQGGEGGGGGRGGEGGARGGGGEGAPGRPRPAPGGGWGEGRKGPGTGEGGRPGLDSDSTLPGRCVFLREQFWPAATDFFGRPTGRHPAAPAHDTGYGSFAKR